MESIIDYRGKTPTKTGEGIPLITAKIIKSGRIETPSEFIAESDYDDWMRRGIPKGGDVVITTEAPLGEVAQLPDKKIALAQRVITLRGRQGTVDNTFLKYLLLSSKFQHDLQARATGTTVVGVKQSVLRKIDLTFPDFDVQTGIAHILGTLDDKIELNRRMSQTLEEMARALFKSWFVDFDPVHAKAALKNHAPLTEKPPTPRQHPPAEQRAATTLGSAPPLPSAANPSGDGAWTVERAQAYLERMDPAIAALFPDSFEDSELGEIPRGWLASTVGNVSRNHDRRRVPLSKKQRSEMQGAFPYYGATGIFDYVDGFLFDGNYLLIGEDGSVAKEDGTAFSQYVSGKIWVNNHAHVLEGSSSVSTEFLYCFFQFAQVAPYVTGAVQLKLSQGRMNRIQLPLASEKILLAFDSAVKPIFQWILLKQKEILSLSELRDTLLPKLISGKLRVPDTEKMLEEIGV